MASARPAHRLVRLLWFCCYSSYQLLVQERARKAVLELHRPAVKLQRIMSGTWIRQVDTWLPCWGKPCCEAILSWCSAPAVTHPFLHPPLLLLHAPISVDRCLFSHFREALYKKTVLGLGLFTRRIQVQYQHKKDAGILKRIH